MAPTLSSGFIYLASPYTHPDPAVMAQRYSLTLGLTTRLLIDGLPVFSPIVYGRQMERDLGHTFEAWQSINDAMIHAASDFAIFRLPGWEQSRGIAHEVDLWRRVKRSEPKIFYELGDPKDADPRYNDAG